MIINSITITNTNFQRRTLVNNNNNNLKGNISFQGPINDSPAKLSSFYTAPVCMPRFAGNTNLFYVYKITSSSIHRIYRSPKHISKSSSKNFFKLCPDGIVMTINQSLPDEIISSGTNIIQGLSKLLESSGKSLPNGDKRLYFSLTRRTRTKKIKHKKEEVPDKLLASAYDCITLNSLRLNEATPEKIQGWLIDRNLLVDSSKSSNTPVNTGMPQDSQAVDFSPQVSLGMSQGGASYGSSGVADRSLIFQSPYDRPSGPQVGGFPTPVPQSPPKSVIPSSFSIQDRSDRSQAGRFPPPPPLSNPGGASYGSSGVADRTTVSLPPLSSVISGEYGRAPRSHRGSVFADRPTVSLPPLSSVISGEYGMS